MKKQKHSPEGLQRLRETALKNRPWESSTGPKTEEGKKRVAMNALKHGFYSELIRHHVNSNSHDSMEN